MEYIATIKENEMDFMYWCSLKRKKKVRYGQSIMDTTIFASLWSDYTQKTVNTGCCLGA